jgi:hypothetical protein
MRQIKTLCMLNPAKARTLGLRLPKRNTENTRCSFLIV